jgi:hypothetical protein
MREHHARAIVKLTERYKDNPKYLAMLIGGSVAKDLAVESSDIDFMLIATDVEYAERMKTKNIHEWGRGICDYEGGYIDGKVMNLAFLEAAADHGSEPTRFSFVDAIIAYSWIPGLEDLIGRITVYPERERAEKIKAFCVQMELAGFLIDEAVKRGDRYLLLHGITELVFYGARVILAHNRMLYPYHKWMMTQLGKAPDKPAGIVELAESLLRDPDRIRAHEYRTRIEEFAGWKGEEENWLDRVVAEDEWSWLHGTPPLPDR